jgi:hypothetical protein
MRKFDKIKNLYKANLLTEQRYLDNNHPSEFKRGDTIIWIAPPKEINRNLRVMTGAKGEYIGSEGGMEYVEIGGYRFGATSGSFEKYEPKFGNVNEYEDNYIPQDGSESGEVLAWEIVDANGDTIYPGSRRPGNIENNDIILFQTTRGNGRISVGDFESQGGDKYDHNTYGLLLSLLADGSAESL